MPSSDAENLDVDISLLQNLRSKISSIDQVRDEFLREVDKVRTEDDCLRDFKSLLEDLNTEKMALVNELRHINTDINMLEQTIKQAEANRQKCIESANRLYTNEMIPLREEINGIRDLMGKERLPMELVDNRDLEEIYPGNRKANGTADGSMEPTTLASMWPFGIACGSYPSGLQLASLRTSSNPFFAAQLMASMTNIHQQPSMTPSLVEDTPSGRTDSRASNSPSLMAEPVVEQTNSRPFGSLGPGPSGSLDPIRQHLDPLLTKQQQPPMKTCASCQQLIHRNAPICPLCKSKSRSRHPKNKKKQSKSDDQQAE